MSGGIQPLTSPKDLQLERNLLFISLPVISVVKFPQDKTILLQNWLTLFLLQSTYCQMQENRDSQFFVMTILSGEIQPLTSLARLTIGMLSLRQYVLFTSFELILKYPSLPPETRLYSWSGAKSIKASILFVFKFRLRI